MQTLIVIPARFGSSRFPGKPLHLIAGTSLIQRVWQIARAAAGVDTVVVATDDERIAAHVASFGGTAVFTPADCRNGSERVFAAVTALGTTPHIVLNLQGDAVLLPPTVISALIAEMRRDPQVQIATPAVRLSADQYAALVSHKGAGIVAGTTVTFARNGDALYFSKGIIPFIRSPATYLDAPPVYQHIGLYAYTHAALKHYISLAPGEFEQVEQLEQLRALEHGIPIRVVQVPLHGRTIWSIDNPEDVVRAEELIRTEGELL
jgi:3-deoxy-manno-octulosonate cytidylyltransferase (CMP-KDO synthetase)